MSIIPTTEPAFSLILIILGVALSRPTLKPSGYDRRFNSVWSIVKFLFLQIGVLILGVIIAVYIFLTSNLNPFVLFQAPFALAIGVLGGNWLEDFIIYQSDTINTNSEQEDADVEHQEKIVDSAPVGFTQDSIQDHESLDASHGERILAEAVESSLDVPSDLASKAEIVEVTRVNCKRYQTRQLAVTESTSREELPPSEFNRRLGDRLREDYYDRTQLVPKDFTDTSVHFLVPDSKTESSCSECHGSGQTDCRTCRGTGKQQCDECSGAGTVTIEENCTTCGTTGKTTCSACSGTGQTKQQTTCHNCNSGKVKDTCPECAGTGENQRGFTCGECYGDGWIKQDCRTCGGLGLITETINCSNCGGRGQFNCSMCNGKGFIPQEQACPKCNREGRITCSSCSGTGKEQCRTCEGEQTTIQFEQTTRRFKSDFNSVYENHGVPVPILDEAVGEQVASVEANTSNPVIKHQKVTQRVPVVSVRYRYSGSDWEIFRLENEEGRLSRTAGPENVGGELKILSAILLFFLVIYGLVFWVAGLSSIRLV